MSAGQHFIRGAVHLPAEGGLAPRRPAALQGRHGPVGSPQDSGLVPHFLLQSVSPLLGPPAGPPTSRRVSSPVTARRPGVAPEGVQEAAAALLPVSPAAAVQAAAGHPRPLAPGVRRLRLRALRLEGRQLGGDGASLEEPLWEEGGEEEEEEEEGAAAEERSRVQQLCQAAQL